MREISKVYGPYIRKDDRYHMVIYFTDGSKTTKSYPKYLMEIKLGRNLEEWETVDHIDGDKTNNDINNLQVMSRIDNSKKSAMKRGDIFSTCPICGKSFKVNRNKIQNAKRKDKKAGPFCSRSCAGKYGAEVQNNRQKVLENNLLGRELEYKNLQGGRILKTI